MNLFIDAHQKLLQSLLDARVEFIIIGGYSVIFHGYTRTTGDIEIWLRPENGNKSKLIKALQAFGIEKESLSAVSELDFTNTVFFKIGEEPERIDFLTKINLVSYESADKRKIYGKIDNLTLPLLHLDHLILSKIKTGRPQDKADVEILQNIHKSKK